MCYEICETVQCAAVSGVTCKQREDIETSSMCSASWNVRLRNTHVIVGPFFVITIRSLPIRIDPLQTDRQTDRPGISELLQQFQQPLLHCYATRHSIHNLHHSLTNQTYSRHSLNNYYSISRWQRSTFNPRHSVSRHQLSGTLCLQLLKVPLPSPLSSHTWKPNCSLLQTQSTFLLSPVPTIWTLDIQRRL